MHLMMSDLFLLSPVFIIITSQIKYPDLAAKHTCQKHVHARNGVSAVSWLHKRRKQKSENHHQETAGASPAVCKIDICVKSEQCL